MLGSATEAEDAVQEAWLRLSRANTDDVANLGGWLTTVVARVCLDMLRSRRAPPRGLRRQLAPRADRHDRERARGRGSASGLRGTRAARRPRNADAAGATRVRPPRHVRNAIRRDRPRR